MEISFQKPNSNDNLTKLRNQYLDGLIHPQEYYVELAVQAANPYLILINKMPAGYFFLSAQDALLEYYIAPEWINQNDSVFGNITSQFGVKTAWCKTYDHDLLSCCYEYQKSTRVLGILFREYFEKPLPSVPSDITVRLAEPGDADRILEINEEVFDHSEEVPVYINAQQIFLFEKFGDLVGFGIFSRCVNNRADFDIGMLVVEKYRRLGYATLILRYLVKHCQENGWRPGAGCYIKNIASRRALEKVGFIARYRLLEFSFLTNNDRREKKSNDY